ncbi:hypothetical protein [Mitsuaria sp. GD03876]|uniref:hypothetical protein n=1 Tax=Mitsuaria sp. GD03876 TaxID=2975399 RepID=UPI00244C3F22|nr:hypothetical protein [Mitsuaria sp. GD03876]MDH0863496.1 hypothetical protein [Mitsuaria sp. GD03876]
MTETPLRTLRRVPSRPSGDISMPSILKKLILLIGLLFVVNVLGLSVSVVIRAVRAALWGDHHEPMAPLTVSFDLLAQALAGWAFLAAMKRVPPASTLLAPRPLVTLLLCVGAIVVTTLWAFGASLMTSLRPSLAVINPAAATPAHAFGGWLPLLLGAIQAEVLHRAVWQSLGASLFGPWLGWIGCALFVALGQADFWSALPTALLLGLVFLRTQSIVCTSALSFAMSASLKLLTGATLTHAAFIPRTPSEPVGLLQAASMLMLALVFDLLHRTFRHPHPSPEGESHDPRPRDNITPTPPPSIRCSTATSSRSRWPRWR